MHLVLTHQNPLFYLREKQNYDQISQFEGLRSFILVEIPNIKLLEKRQNKS